MIFVTLGSQRFQFDRLLREVDRLVEQGNVAEPIFAQTGYSEYIPQRYPYKPFLNREEFAQYQSRADIVITHGGTGAIIGAVKHGKKVIAVPRMEKFGEHVDDHQLQLIEQFVQMALIIPCWDIRDLGDCLKAAADAPAPKYVSNTHRIIESIEEFLDSIDV